MDGEINNFVNIFLVAITSLCYCYYVAARLRRGITRLVALLPIFYLFITLPLNLSSFHLGAATALIIVWLANFKLLLFAFDNGPLFSNPALPLLHFISFALLPITPAKHVKTKVFRPILLGIKIVCLDLELIVRLYDYRLIVLALKFVFLPIIVHLYGYRQYVHPSFISALNCCHLYLGIELTLVMGAILAHDVIGLEIEPQFDKPYLATSLQDFWGRRWNLHVSYILRLTVYNPALRIGTRIFGRRWGRPPAVFVTFLVSGLMHEICFYYLARVPPTWEVTCLFVVHGLWTATEVAAKPAVAGRYRLHRVVSRLLTMGFVGVSVVWIFLPQMIKNGVDLKLVNEYSIFSSFMRHKIISLLSYFLSFL